MFTATNLINATVHLKRIAQAARIFFEILEETHQKFLEEKLDSNIDDYATEYVGKIERVSKSLLAEISSLENIIKFVNEGNAEAEKLITVCNYLNGKVAAHRALLSDSLDYYVNSLGERVDPDLLPTQGELTKGLKFPLVDRNGKIFGIDAAVFYAMAEITDSRVKLKLEETDPQDGFRFRILASYLMYLSEYDHTAIAMLRKKASIISGKTDALGDISEIFNSAMIDQIQDKIESITAGDIENPGDLADNILTVFDGIMPANVMAQTKMGLRTMADKAIPRMRDRFAQKRGQKQT